MVVRRVVTFVLSMTVDPLTSPLPFTCPRNPTTSVIVPRNLVMIIVIHSVATIVFIIIVTSVV